MRFRSAIDIWFYLLAPVLPIVVILLVVFFIKSANMQILIVLGVSTLIACGLPIWLLFTTYYVVKSGELKIQSGPIRKVIHLTDIKAVSPSRSMLSSPALSLNQLEIRYGQNRSVLVSPKDIEGFLIAVGQDTR